MSTESVATNDPTLRQESDNISKKMFGGDQAAWRALQKRSDMEGILRCGGHTALVLVFGAAQYYFWYNNAFFLSWIFLTAQALCMAFLFTGFHEMTHRTAFATNSLSDGFGHLWGFVIFRPLRHYTYYHYNHHKFTGDPSRDPELQDSFIDLKLDNAFNYVVYLSAVPYWIDRLSTLFRHGVMGWVLPREEAFVTKNTKPMMIAEARLYCALYFSILGASIYSIISASNEEQAAGTCTFGELVWQLWILPTIVAQPFLRFYLVGEHTGCPQGNNMLSNTRTTKTYAWYRWLAWNMPYHAEHHAYPFVPFHRLPELHQHLLAMKTDSFRHCDPNGENGYLGVHIGIVKRFLGLKK